MRVGLLGGTFDPVHLAHLVMAEQCREQCELDEVWFVPAGRPPHKQHMQITPAGARQEMLQLAIAGHSDFQMCSVEIDRDETTFTIDTLSSLTAQFPEHVFWFILGADSLYDLPNWKQPERIVEHARVLAVNRGAADLEQAHVAATIGHHLAEHVDFASMPAVNLSASDIRRRVAAGRSIRYLVPRAVEVYIHEHSLYRAADIVTAETQAGDQD